MSLTDLQSRVEAMREKDREQEDAQRRVVRAELERTGLAPFLDECREVFGEDQVRLAHLSTSTMNIGRPIARGLKASEMVIEPRGADGRPIVQLAATAQAGGASRRGAKRR